MIDDDSTDTYDTLTGADDALIREDGSPTDTEDTLNDLDNTLIREDESLTDTDDTLNSMDYTLTNTDDSLIDNDDPLIGSKDALTNTDDTLIGKDVSPINTNDANDVLPKRDKDLLNMAFVLSIDGGGIRGYSSLMILQALMEEIEGIERANNPTATSSICSSAPRPPDAELCAVPNTVGRPISERQLSHYFDYIGGTGSGNVIATMLIDEKMSIAEVMEIYRAMCAPGRPRRLIKKQVVFSKRDQTSIWLQEQTIIARKLPKLAWATLVKHKAAIPAHNADPLHIINNASRTVLEAAHFRLIDDSSAKHGISLLSIGGAITEPVHRRADSLRSQQSRQTRRVHEELSFRTRPSENPNGRLFNLKHYSRLDVKDDVLGDIIGERGWGSETSDERTRCRIGGATVAYLQREEVRDEVHRLAVCLVNKRRVREGRLKGERGARGIGDRYSCFRG